MPASGPSDLSQFNTAVSFQLRAYLRTYRFLGLVAFTLVLALAFVGVDAYRGVDAVKATSPTASDFLAGFLNFLPDAVVLAAAFLGGDALAVDLAGGPGYLMLTLPVRRTTLLAGRYVAAAITGFSVALVYYAVAVGASLGFYGTVPAALLLSVAAALLFGLAALAIAFFFSSFFRTPAVAIVASMLILLLGFPSVTAIGTLAGPEPWFSLDYGSRVVATVLSSNFAHETVRHLAGARAGVSITIYEWNAYYVEGLLILAGYLLMFLLATWLVYRWKEVKG